MIISDKKNFIEIDNGFIEIDGNWMKMTLPYSWFVHSQTCSTCNSLNDKIKNESNERWYIFATNSWSELDFVNTKYDTDVIIEGDSFETLYIDNIQILEIDNDTISEIVEAKKVDDRDSKLHGLLGCTRSLFKSNSFIPKPMFYQISEDQAQQILEEMRKGENFIEFEGDIKMKIQYSKTKNKNNNYEDNSRVQTEIFNRQR